MLTNRRSTHQARWIVGAVAVALRLAAAVVTGGMTHPEVNEYNSIARAMLDGRGFIFGHLSIIYYSYAPPLHAWITAASYWLTGSIAPVMVLQVLAGGLVAVLAVVLAERLFGGRWAPLGAGLLVAVHPGLIVYSATKAHPLIFDALFFTLALLQILRLAGSPSVNRGLVLGAIIGTGALSRGTTVIFLPIGGLWLLWTAARASRPRVVRSLVAACLLAAAIIAPWSVRNSMIHHQFVWLLSTDSEDFWRGNNPNATGDSYVRPGLTVLNALPAAERADLDSQPTEMAQAQWFMDRARRFITAHPGAFVRLTWLKFCQFWWFAPQTGVHYPSAWYSIYATYYVTALVLAAIGLWRVLSSGEPARSSALLLLLFLGGLSGLQSLYYVEGRHRWAVEPMLLVLSGGGAQALLAYRRKEVRPVDV